MSDYERVLVAFDGSANAQRALSTAISLAKSTDSALSIVVVLPPSPYEEDLKIGNDLLGKAVAIAKRTLVDAEGVLRDGQPADEILQLAEERKSDLIVIGRRGMSGIQRFLIGGVSSTVVNHSRCDVLVVK